LTELALTMLTALHLACVDVAAAGPLVCALCEWKAGRGDNAAAGAARFLATASIVGLLAGGALGVAMGAVLWSREYQHALSRFGSRIHFGGLELLFSLALVAGYAVWIRLDRKAPWWRRLLRILLLVAAATNLLYHFPLLFIMLSNIAGESGGEIGSREFVQTALQGEVLSRAVHFWLASAATTGLLLVGWALWRARRNGERLSNSETESARLARWGGRLALTVSLLQIPTGVWVLFQLPVVVQHALLGGDLLATGVFVLSLCAAGGLQLACANLSFGDTRRGVAFAAIAAGAIVIVSMSAVLQRTKAIRTVGDENVSVDSRTTGRP